jgi:HPt (histidine-containing phosphotransfer) domain-containing protein
MQKTDRVIRMDTHWAHEHAIFLCFLASAAAIAEAKRLREQNEQLEVLAEQEEVWQRRQKVFYAVHCQFAPHGSGVPSNESMKEFDAAEEEWRKVQKEVQRIVDEIRSGKRK